ncbi:serine protease [Acinetobacter soli]|uniref:S1 family peptidase n=1 Tax=Acinetobacter soli TaxID=487316 RepID=UPI002B31EFF1|nr:serine protease [Acinetobacter soli]
MDFSKTYQKVRSSVVKVITGNIINDKVEILSVGTGVVVLNGHHVLTCNHCLKRKPGSHVLIEINDNKQFILAKILYSNIELDIALLRTDLRLGEPANLIDSNHIMMGMECFVVGYPNSIMQKTFLAGHIASITENHFLLDCSVNHGNSGGPLFDLEGNLIAIINAKHGGMNDVLKELKDNHLAKNQGGVFISGIDPLAVFNEILESMNRNLNLGIGYAVKTNIIKEKIPDLF